MNVTVILEHRFDRTPDGAVWTQTQFASPFWDRYLEVFDAVRVVARVREIAAPAPDSIRADGERVTFAAVPHYLGPVEFVRRARSVRRTVRAAVTAESALIMRVQSHLGSLVEPMVRGRGQPYGVEVVYDPYDMFAPGSMTHPTRPFFRWLYPRQLRAHCARAAAAAYVTEHALQARYPPGPQTFATYYSDVELPDEAIVSSPPTPRADATRFALVTTMSFEHLYKAPDVLIDAVALCVRQGSDLTLTLLGDGSHRTDLEDRARNLGIEDRIHFLGKVTAGAAVRSELDKADLFVLPSRQEGLPRAIVEAMARGLPCIGSDVGGIPELLPPDVMVPAGDTQALARKIREVLSNPNRRAEMSARNLAKVDTYREDALHGRRVAFYRAVRDRTAAWMSV